MSHQGLKALLLGTFWETSQSRRTLLKGRGQDLLLARVTDGDFGNIGSNRDYLTTIEPRGFFHARYFRQPG